MFRNRNTAAMRASANAALSTRAGDCPVARRRPDRLALRTAARHLPLALGGRGRVARLAALALLIGASSIASADVNKAGAYVTGMGGFNALGNQSIAATIDGVTSRGDVAFSGSYLAGFAVGYRFGNNWAIEEEVVFRRAIVDEATLDPLGTFTDGNFENTQLSFNVLYHFPVADNDDIEAYLGVGIAYLPELDFDIETVDGEQPFEDDLFGIELHAGLRYYGWRHAFAGIGLRYLSVSDAELPAPSDTRNIVTTDYDPYSVVLEIGWRF